ERIGGPFDDYPWRFVLCDYLPGRPSCAVGLDAAQRAAACEPLARFLAALHGLPLSDPAVAAAPEDELDRMLPSVRIARAERDIGRALGAGLIDDGTPFERILAALPATWRPGTRALVHGDLYARHLLVDDDGRPCAVIDWGDVHRGEPALDLSFPACFLPPGSRRAFERHYGAIDDGDWAAARMKGVQHALNIGLFGLEVRDHDLAAEARRSLDHLAADAD
ncbi:MAG: phosphotransferase, partial [Planctomycetota bacterium]